MAAEQLGLERIEREEMLHNYHVRVDLKVLWSRKLRVRGQGRKLARKYHFVLEPNQSKCWGVLRSSPVTFWPPEQRCHFGFMDFKEFFGVRPKDVGFEQIVIKNIIKDRCESKLTRERAGKGPWWFPGAVIQALEPPRRSWITAIVKIQKTSNGGFP